METRYPKAQALKVIRKILEEGGSLSLSGHYKKRMIERGVDMHDVLSVIKTGRIFIEPEPHIRSGKWVYTIEGTAGEETLKVPVAIYEDSRMVVIVTVI